jgi:spermidine/putrescine transport system permease protein
VSRRCLWIYVVLGYLFLYLPIAVLVVFSFNASRLNVNWEGFTLAWYAKLLTNASILAAAKNSLLIAAVTTVLSTVLGTGLALGMHRNSTALGRITELFVYVPVIVPETVMGISLLAFFVLTNIQLGVTSVIISHVAFCAPFVALIVQARLEGFDDSLVEAALDLGATEWQALFRVTLPVAAPGIVAGGLLAFTMSLDDFIVTFFTAGPGSTTLPLYIFSMVKFGVSPEINALCTVLLVISAAAIVAYDKLVRIRD